MKYIRPTDYPLTQGVPEEIAKWNI